MSDPLPPTPVVLDVDTGVDDALALLAAVRAPEVDLLAVTCVGGNVPVEQAVHNTLRVLDAAGAVDVPVARGNPGSGAVRDDLVQAHGADGLGGVDLPAPRRTAVDEPAVELLRRTLASAARPVTVVGLGPLTNLAQLLREHPRVVESIERVVVAAGVRDPAAAAVADFNVDSDARAMVEVTGARVPVTVCPVDLTRTVRVLAGIVDSLQERPHPVQRLAGRLLAHQLRRGDGRAARLGDAVTMTCVVNPDLLATQRLAVWLPQLRVATRQVDVGEQLSYATVMAFLHAISGRGPAGRAALSGPLPPG